VAKIERPEALEHLEQIVDAADAVMVARGDLGVEIDIARVPLVQKQILDISNARRVPVITATQMLESMRSSNRPTRAEASDVAHAILDGSDALMLSGETAIGDYPVDAVRTMSRIARETEWLLRTAETPPTRWTRPIGVTDVTEAVAHGAGRVAVLLDANLVVVATHSGRTALALSKQRNFVPTVGVSDSDATLRRMALYWGVTPLRASATQDSRELLDFVVAWGRQENLLQRGDRVVLLASTHWHAVGHNLLMVHEVE
jgi:pyruvate kinase